MLVALWTAHPPAWLPNPCTSFTQLTLPLLLPLAILLLLFASPNPPNPTPPPGGQHGCMTFPALVLLSALVSLSAWRMLLLEKIISLSLQYEIDTPAVTD